MCKLHLYPDHAVFIKYNKTTIIPFKFLFTYSGYVFVDCCLALSSFFYQRNKEKCLEEAMLQTIFFQPLKPFLPEPSLNFPRADMMLRLANWPRTQAASWHRCVCAVTICIPTPVFFLNSCSLLSLAQASLELAILMTLQTLTPIAVICREGNVMFQNHLGCFSHPCIPLKSSGAPEFCCHYPIPWVH